MGIQHARQGLRASTRVLRLVVAVAVLALAATFSCKTFDLPGEICNPSQLDARRPRGEAADGPCSRCLETKCCDKVGICERKESCPELVRAAHDCVLGAELQGAAVEATCAEPLGAVAEATDTYRCMRDSCGAECALPVCRVDQAAGLLQTASCDGCFSSSCCPQLNACYRSRACKLTLECIVDECKGKLGESLVAAATNPAFAPPDGAAGIDVDQEDVKRICDDKAPSGFFPAPSCVRTCLCRFRDNDQGLLPPPELRPFTLALRIYECGAKASCGSKCPDPAAGTGRDASTDTGAIALDGASDGP